jgi:hypothetical protein
MNQSPGRKSGFARDGAHGDPRKALSLDGPVGSGKERLATKSMVDFLRHARIPPAATPIE